MLLGNGETFILNLPSDMFADHIGNLTVELVLASAEVRNKQCCAEF